MSNRRKNSLRSLADISTPDAVHIKAWTDAADVACAVDYLGLNETEGYVWGMIRGAPAAY